MPSLRTRCWVWSVACAIAASLGACKQLDPIRTTDYCSDPTLPVISEHCPSCISPPYAAQCPQCQGEGPSGDCTASQSRPVTGAGAGAQGSSGQTGGATPGGTAGVAGHAAASGRSGGATAGTSALAGQSGAAAMSGGSGVGALGGSGALPTGGPCRSNADCAAPYRACRFDLGVCVECTADANCGQGVCQPNLYRCVQCLNDQDCPSGKVCDPTTNSCVMCVQDVQCTDATLGTCSSKRECVDCDQLLGGCDDPAKPACVGQTCMECAQDSQCHGTNKRHCLSDHTCVACVMRDGDCPDPNAPVCDVDSHSCVQCLDAHDCASGHCVDRSCVQCESDADCGTASAGRCDTSKHSCVSCTDSSQCSHLSGTPVCDTSSGACVGCLSTLDCPNTTCIMAQHTCSNTPRHSLATCDPCQSDDDCGTQALCFPATFGASAAPLGYFCFNFAAEAGCGAFRPYDQTQMLSSIDHRVQPACLPPASTTCQGIKDATRIKPCSGQGDQCGVVGLTDAVCTGSYCTYTCSKSQNDDDCPLNLKCGDGNVCQ